MARRVRAGPTPRVEGVEKELDRLRQELAGRDDLLAIAAHELRNPLHTLMLQLALARSTAEAGDAAAAAARIEKAQDTLRHCASRVTLLLDLTRLNAQAYPLTLRQADLGAVLRKVVDALAFEARFRAVDVALSLPAAGCQAVIDSVAFEQIVSDLLLNAFRHSACKTVRVSLQEVDAHWLQLEVADDGRGIAADDQTRVFGKFRVAQGGERGLGAGLGLWIVRKLVDALGGTIDLASQPDAGAAFRVRLPRRQPTGAP